MEKDNKKNIIEKPKKIKQKNTFEDIKKLIKETKQPSEASK